MILYKQDIAFEMLVCRLSQLKKPSARSKVAEGYLL